MTEVELAALAISLQEIANRDVHELIQKERNYGGSWKARGGQGGFFVTARKWDRLENHVKSLNYDIFKALEQDRRPEGVIDDIRDLRCYLMLIEAEAEAQGWLAKPDVDEVLCAHKHDPTGQDHPHGYHHDEERCVPRQLPYDPTWPPPETETKHR